jgi:hypothetical protein
MTAGSESFEDRDQVEVALRELVEAGLAHRVGSFAFAAHAGASFDRLWAA